MFYQSPKSSILYFFWACFWMNMLVYFHGSNNKMHNFKDWGKLFMQSNCKEALSVFELILVDILITALRSHTVPHTLTFSESRFSLEHTGKWGALKFDPPSSHSCNYAFWNWGAGKVSEVKRGLNTPDKSACVHVENSLLPFLSAAAKAEHLHLLKGERVEAGIRPCGWLCLIISAVMWDLRGWGGDSVVTYGEKRDWKQKSESISLLKRWAVSVVERGFHSMGSSLACGEIRNEAEW